MHSLQINKVSASGLDSEAIHAVGQQTLWSLPTAPCACEDWRSVVTDGNLEAT